MSTQLNQLDVEMMQRLYGFGGLRSFRVVYFDKVSFEVREARRTFNEEVAKVFYNNLIKDGFTAAIFDDMIHFDGAFAKQPE